MHAAKIVAGMTAVNILAMAVVVSQAASAPSAAAPEVLRAQGIELVDAQGRVRASLGVEDGGDAVFRIRGANGEIRVKIGGSDAGSGLVMMNGDAAPGIHMLAKDSGSSIKLIEPGKPVRTIAP